MMASVNPSLADQGTQDTTGITKCPCCVPSPDTGMPTLGCQGWAGCSAARAPAAWGGCGASMAQGATLGHRRQGSSSGNLPPAYAPGSRTLGCRGWVKGAGAAASGFAASQGGVYLAQGHWDAMAGMSSCESTDRMGRLRCLDGSRCAGWSLVWVGLNYGWGVKATGRCQIHSLRVCGAWCVCVCVSVTSVQARER